MLTLIPNTSYKYEGKRKYKSHMNRLNYIHHEHSEYWWIRTVAIARLLRFSLLQSIIMRSIPKVTKFE